MISENDSVDSSLTHSDSIRYDTEYYNYRKMQLKKINKLTIMSSQVKKRVRALKNLMVSQNEIESKFIDEVYLLRLKYQKEYEPYFNKMTNIVQGKYEPTKGEYSSSSEEEDEEASKYNEIGLELREQVPKGIPDFWFVFMKNAPMIQCIVQPSDYQILKHLSGIRCTRSDEYTGFTIEFYFTPNQWFTNDLLTLKFERQYLDSKRKIIIKYMLSHYNHLKITSGCDINWNTGKNVTQNNFTNQDIDDPCNEIIAESASFFNLFNDNLINSERLCFELIFHPGYFDSIFRQAYFFYIYKHGVTGQYSHNTMLYEQLSDSEDNESD